MRHAHRRWRWSRRRRWGCRIYRTLSARRWSWWPTAWWIGIRRRLRAQLQERGDHSRRGADTGAALEVHRPDGVGLERRGQAVDLLLHVGLDQTLEVLEDVLGAAVELEVEAVDGRLVEDVHLAPLAVRAAQEDLPVRGRGLLPLDRVDQVAIALRAEVQIADLGGGGSGGRLGAVEIDDLDGASRRKDDALDVVRVVCGLVHLLRAGGLWP